VKPGEMVKKKNPFLAILPQQGIIFLSIFAVIYAFIRGVETWDYYLLNVVWGIWSVWTMSGICIAAIKTHRWVGETTSEKQKEPSFFLRARELFITILLTLFITFFFTVADMSKVNQLLSNFRQKVLSIEGAEKHSTMIHGKVTPPIEASTSSPEEKIERPKDESYVPEKKEGTEDIKLARVAEPAEEKKVPVKEDRWIVQVAAVRTQKEAMAFKEKLMASGFPAYSGSAMVKKEEWIRVRVGFFKNKDEAQKAGEEIRERCYFKGPYWITRVSQKEMEGLVGK
jgi:hypothetical protein